MSSSLNSDIVQVCANCEYSYLEHNNLLCMINKIETTYNNVCLNYDYSNTELTNEYYHS